MSQISEMTFGSKPVDGGNLLLSKEEVAALRLTRLQYKNFIRRFYGSAEFIKGLQRYCLWIEDEFVEEVKRIKPISDRIEIVRNMRSSSRKFQTVAMVDTPHKFGEIRQTGDEQVLAVAAVSSENRDYLPCGLLPPGTIVSNAAFAIYDAPLWNMAIVASRLHLIWIKTVCGQLETRIRYSNTLGWNTFPVPQLTENNKKDLTHCAQDILLAREAHFPATIADLYNPEKMPEDLRRAHERNDEVLERIYIGRRFRNDTERLEELFALYTKMSQEKVY